MTTVTRRNVLKSGTALAGGIAGILATGRAPAFAQGTTLQWLRWNDFVPASDQLLRKEILPAAEKALGIKVNLETVNGNDLQPRITSAIQSGAGPDIIMLFNNHPQIYSESVIDLSDLASSVGKSAEVYRAARNYRRRHDRLPEIVVRRDRLAGLPRHLGEVSRGWQEAQSRGPA